MASKPVRLRVLVADDDRDTANLLAAILRDEGHDVHIALRGDEVSEIDRLIRPDALILDINMPGMILERGDQLVDFEGLAQRVLHAELARHRQVVHVGPTRHRDCPMSGNLLRTAATVSMPSISAMKRSVTTASTRCPSS